ncbi:hypothetical protein NGRA_1337 [Nosema granulosis]|uniref:ORM1-like protein 2 n=1 Tax=Nosema granulosis TaxID=83296 RepID=A0A9P6KZ96_9MICR|nr:hypothetical protein NGRA_1337 [Nosema granulosis]
MKINRVDVSENISWVFQKGSWSIHVIFTAVIKLTLAQFMTENFSWQATILTYNVLTFLLFHWKVGDPFSSQYFNCTFWEQLNEQAGGSIHMRFLSLYPVILFIIVNKIVDWNKYMFCIYMVSLFMVVIPKLSFMHLRRVFGYRSHN